ncbi:MAG: dicarboxylate/amino acid:cation symporter [Sorangiineae bacterium NIC37A_2]|jgi:Na+/H+-dicarboxylate symporter|nr:MAG: dicarboxylate/amino acid:cation symporter [Sorangiineae bacterium NIC37A_2]
MLRRVQSEKPNAARVSGINIPLYAQIALAMVLGVVVGLLLGPGASFLDWPARLVLRVLGAVAPPLILIAVMRALVTAEFAGNLGLRLAYLLVTNTLVAIGIGLLVANVIQPGAHTQLLPSTLAQRPSGDVVGSLLDNVPKSFVAPLVDGRVIGVVLVAVLFGLAGRGLAAAEKERFSELLSLGMNLLGRVLGWILHLVPIAVFSKVASIVGVEGFRPFGALLWFILAVLLALLLQGLFYVGRIRWNSWVRPRDLRAHLLDPLVMAFSTASSTATMPVTYDRLRRLGLRERSASLGALVGSNFNNDGTALYEAMAALFVAQMLNVPLSWTAQGLIVLTSVIASVGAAGIPEAGLVTMTLVFNAANLPIEAIAFLLAVDWFLDRARTAINVLGDVTVACVLDGQEREVRSGPEDAGKTIVSPPAESP